MTVFLSRLLSIYCGALPSKFPTQKQILAYQKELNNFTKQGSEEMPRRRRSWFRVAKKKLFRSSISRSPSSRAIILHYNTSGSFTSVANSTPRSKIVPFFSREELAAIKIQACFRGHLAKRAFRALRSLVKLQAVVRGVLVRRQARIALQCMYALARIQLTVRARQLLIIR